MKKFLPLLFVILFTFSCKPDDPDNFGNKDKFEYVVPTPKAWDGEKKGDVTYQLLLYSFADSDGDRWGDMRGLIDKLDYLDTLGVSALWLSPIHPSMSYHGYDVTDYYSINQKYGDDNTFSQLLHDANNKKIKIYLDYVINHTGREHPWFKPLSEYYIFSENPKSDITKGKIDMIATEGSSGYDSAQWFSISDNTSKKYLFTLDWSNNNNPTVTVTLSDKVDLDNPDTSPKEAKYLYFGEEVCKKLYYLGNNIYTLSVDFSSSWGFLIRTSNVSWGEGTKYGASKDGESTISLGVPFKLFNSSNNDDIKDIKMPGGVFFHSHFQTNWFADLNYGKVENAENSVAFKEITSSAKKWMDLGVEGFRLDAVKHIYHNANSDENPRFLKKFYNELNGYYKGGNSKGIYMVGEVLSEHQEVEKYYSGLPALFEFSFWWRLKEAINSGIGKEFAKEIISYRNSYSAYKSDFIAAIKLSNHDEDRTGSELGGLKGRMKLAAAVLLTSEGSPYIYYGEELGYSGTKSGGDEYVRQPMKWGDKYSTSYTDKIDPLFASKIPDLSSQVSDTSSVFKVYKDFIRVRNTYDPLAFGKMVRHGVYNETNTTYPAISGWYMIYGKEKLLVIHNFGAISVSIPINDQIKSAIASQGGVYIKRENHAFTLKMEPYSSVVFEL